jgi:hypothetical protein
MSTTPSTTDNPYTVVGSGAGRSAGRGISAVVLNRASRQTRAEALARFELTGVDEALAVLDSRPHYDVEQLAGKLSRTRFILLGKSTSVGQQVNIAMREARSPYVLVVWSDCEPPAVTEKILEQVRQLNALCVVPALRTEKGAPAPSLVAPASYGARLRTVLTPAGGTIGTSLYPYANIGIFDRDRFLSIGGYDDQMQSGYWQSMDFGFRSYLWGESIRSLPGFRVRMARALPPDDTTADADYARFHLKNLSIRFSRDSGRLSQTQLLRFLKRSGLGITGGLREFAAIRRWVNANRYRFVQDARRVTELWEVGE